MEEEQKQNLEENQNQNSKEEQDQNIREGQNQDPEEEQGQNLVADEGPQDSEVKKADSPVAEGEMRELLKRILEEIQINAGNALALMGGIEAPSREQGTRKAVSKARELGKIIEEGAGKIIEGVFDGQNMVGPDGKKYGVAANYASKSKLVEGDIMKLTILSDGTFLYKQIGPQKRARLRGLLVQDRESEEYRVLAEGKTYNVLPASVTYFKGAGGDEVIILVPEDRTSAWAAVENIIKKPQGQEMSESVNK